jgi:hypothetical protein
MLTRVPFNEVNGAVVSAGSGCIVDFNVAAPLLGSMV